MIIWKLDWVLHVEQLRLQYDHKKNTISYSGHILPCTYSDGVCPPTAAFPATLIWEPQKHCVIFFSHDFQAKMIKYNNRYWIESLPNITTFEKPKSPFHRTEPPAYTRIEIFEEQTFLCNTPTPYHVTQYEDVFITYTGGFDISPVKFNHCQKRS